MSDQTQLDGAPKRLKQDQVLILVFLGVLAVLFLVFLFTSVKPDGTNGPQQENSLAQALTLVAGASQTALVGNPGLSTNQVNPVSVTPQVGAITSSPAPSSSIKAASTQASQFTATATRNSIIPSPTKSATPSQNNNNQDTVATFPVSNATVRPTYTPKPTETPRPADSPTPTITSTATQAPGLPGLTMSAVVSQLKNDKGFVCSQAESAPGPILWMCDVQTGNDLWYHIDIYGSIDVDVNNLLVSVFQTNPDDTKAIDILSYIAALPYTGSDASAARQWVTQTLPGIKSVDDVKEIFIGGVRFRLYGGPQGRYLEMGEPVQQ